MYEAVYGAVYRALCEVCRELCMKCMKLYIELCPWGVYGSESRYILT